jgi:peptidoglycan DL-endopeptidase CwlO
VKRLRARKRLGRDPISIGTSGGIGRRLIPILLILAVITLVCSEAVRAEPAAITEAKQEAAALEARIDELNEQLGAAVEDYNYATEKLSQTQAAIKDKQAKLAQAEADLGVLQDQLTERVVEIYKQGHLGMLDTLVGASSFSDLINRLNLLERVSAQDTEMLDQVAAYGDRVSNRQSELAQQLEEEKVLLADAESAKAKVEETLAANQEALKGKEAQIAQLQKEEAERQARLAAEARAKAEAARKAEEARKAAAAAAARQAAAAAGGSSSSSSRSSSGGSSGGSSSVNVSVPDSASTSDVVSIAMQYLGSRYVWAGASPDGFDCSGFTMYVYRKVGISLPHSSRMQYGVGRAVSRSELRPGDLLFFYNPIHHVAIYIGDGKMIHAAGVGKGVRIDSIYRNSYYGACRIIL